MSTLVEFALLLFFLNASYESEHLTSKSFRVIFHAIFIIRILTYIQIQLDKKQLLAEFQHPFSPPVPRRHLNVSDLLRECRI